MVEACRLRKVGNRIEHEGPAYICPKALTQIMDELPENKWVVVEFGIMLDDDNIEVCTGEARIIEG